MAADRANPIRGICEASAFVLTTEQPDPTKAILTPPGYYMQMQLEDALLGRLVRQSNAVHALGSPGRLDRASNADHRRRQLGSQSGLHLQLVNHAGPRNGQGVAGNCGV